MWKHFVHSSNNSGQHPSRLILLSINTVCVCVCVCVYRVCSLRQVKIEQRKLNDSSNSLVDMAKVRP